MRKLLLLPALFLCLALSAVAPVSLKLGRVDTVLEEGSLAAVALEAVKAPYTEQWLEAYAEDAMLFAEAYSPLLSSALPMGNVLVGEERGGSLSVLDQDTGLWLSLTFQGGRLSAVKPMYLPEGIMEEEEEELFFEEEQEELPGEEIEEIAVEEDLPETFSDPGVPYLYEIRFPSAP